MEAAPITLSLVMGAAFFWIVGSIAIGVIAAATKGSLLDRALMVLGSHRHLHAGLLAGRDRQSR